MTSLVPDPAGFRRLNTTSSTDDLKAGDTGQTRYRAASRADHACHRASHFCKAFVGQGISVGSQVVGRLAALKLFDELIMAHRDDSASLATQITFYAAVSTGIVAFDQLVTRRAIDLLHTAWRSRHGEPPDPLSDTALHLMSAAPTALTTSFVSSVRQSGGTRLAMEMDALCLFARLGRLGRDIFQFYMKGHLTAAKLIDPQTGREASAAQKKQWDRTRFGYQLAGYMALVMIGTLVMRPGLQAGLKAAFGSDDPHDANNDYLDWLGAALTSLMVEGLDEVNIAVNQLHWARDVGLDIAIVDDERPDDWLEQGLDNGAMRALMGVPVTEGGLWALKADSGNSLATSGSDVVAGMSTSAMELRAKATATGRKFKTKDLKRLVQSIVRNVNDSMVQAGQPPLTRGERARLDKGIRDVARKLAARPEGDWATREERWGRLAALSPGEIRFLLGRQGDDKATSVDPDDGADTGYTHDVAELAGALWALKPGDEIVVNGQKARFVAFRPGDEDPVLYRLADSKGTDPARTALDPGVVSVPGDDKGQTVYWSPLSAPGTPTGSTTTHLSSIASASQGTPGFSTPKPGAVRQGVIGVPLPALSQGERTRIVASIIAKARTSMQGGGDDQKARVPEPSDWTKESLGRIVDEVHTEWGQRFSLSHSECVRRLESVSVDDARLMLERASSGEPSSVVATSGQPSGGGVSQPQALTGQPVAHATGSTAAVSTAAVRTEPRIEVHVDRLPGAPDEELSPESEDSDAGDRSPRAVPEQEPPGVRAGWGHSSDEGARSDGKRKVHLKGFTTTWGEPGQSPKVALSRRAATADPDPTRQQPPGVSAGTVPAGTRAQPSTATDSDET